MRELKGIAVSGGSRVGRAVTPEEVPYAVEPVAIAPADVPREIDRLDAAVEAALRGLDESRGGLDPQVGAIFDSHRLMLESVHGRLSSAVRSGASAEHAVASVLRGYANRFAASPDPMVAERKQDVLDLERRLLRALSGRTASGLPEGLGQGGASGGPFVVVAEDLTPTEAAALDVRRVAGLVLEHGGPTSHTAIIAKSLGLPCVVGVPGVCASVEPGEEVWVDGTTGAVVVAPDDEAKDRAVRASEAWEEAESRLLARSHLPAETLDGHAVTLLANIEFPLEVAAAVARGASGIGLYRTEFLFDPARPVPGEEAHLASYREALERVGAGRLTIRTFDFGSDKASPGGGSGEANPALGARSLRWCFAHPDVFRPQLRAILRVAAEGDVRVMLPMVGGPEDVRAAREWLARDAADLAKAGVRHRADPPVGAMIEVPAAAVTADLLAREVDFFSIGTNDLIQYGLAVDRTNELVAQLFQPSHPAILRLIRRTVEAAATRNLPVTMCGEMAGEAAYTVLLLGLGIREFSLTPAVLPRVRNHVRQLTLARARAIAARCLRLATAADVDSYLRSALG
jgi:phosphotransferase system enzyme I (PtsI)